MVTLTTVKKIENNGFKVWVQSYDLPSGKKAYQFKVFDEDGDTITYAGYDTGTEAYKAAINVTKNLGEEI